MSLRAMDGSYAAGGKYHTQIAKNLQPSFAAAAGPVMNLNVFVLVSMLATACLAHYNPLLALLCLLCYYTYHAHYAHYAHYTHHAYQAFLAHYNAPKFFKELAGPEDGSSKLPRFNQVSRASVVGIGRIVSIVSTGL